MRRELLLITSLLLVILLASTISAIEMRRTYNFDALEEKTYNFLGKEYTIKVIHSAAGGRGKVQLKINGFDKEATTEIPAVFEDLKVSINKLEPFKATLDMVWQKEDTPPDANFQIPENTKKIVDADGKKFSVLVKNIDKVKNVATIEINGEKIILGENEKTSLEDESVFKMHAIAGTSVRNIEFSIWASDVKSNYQGALQYDAEGRIGEREQATLFGKGLPINIRVDEITRNEDITITIMGETFEAREGDTLKLENNITALLSKLSMKQPESVMLSLIVPEKLAEEITTSSVTRTISTNQKDEFESEGRVIRTLAKEIGSEKGMFVINEKNVTIGLGETKQLGDISVTAKILNAGSHPAKAILVFDISKKLTRRQIEAKEDQEKKEENIEREEESIVCAQDVEECPDGSFVSRNPDKYCKFDACPEVKEEEIPEPEVPEIEEDTSDREVLSFTESAKWTWNYIAGFFKGLFS